MKSSVILPSGRTCRPLRLRSIYGTFPVFLNHCQLYGIARRISRESPLTLWKRNPFLVSSVIPSDFAEYSPKKHPTRRAHRLCPHGVPRYVRCYDNGGESCDRYTVCFTGRAAVERSAGHAAEYPYRAMSAHPFDPQGFGMWCSSKNQPADTMREKRGWHWPPAMGRKCHLGRRIAFADLPADCQRLVLADYKEIWKL